MALDRDAIRAALERSRAGRGGGGVNFLKEGTFKLRVLEFTDPMTGHNLFSRVVYKWSKQVAGKKQDACVNRWATWQAPDAFEKARELAADAGAPWEYECKGQHYVNAIDVTKANAKVERWALPHGVWQDISTLVLSDEWADVLEADKGHPFIIVGTGAGFSRTYTCQPDRRPWPVDPALLSGVVDPWAAAPDVGLQKQCELLGLALEDLFPDPGVLEAVEPLTFGSAPPAAAPAAPAALPDRDRTPAAPAARQAPPGSPPPTSPPPGLRGAPPPAAPSASPGARSAAGGSVLAGLVGRRR